VHVIPEMVCRSGGGGYLDKSHPGHIWIVAAPRSPEDKVTPKQLTNGNFTESGAVFSKDGSQIYYQTSRVTESYYELPTTEIYSVPVSGGQPTLLTKVNLGVGGLTLSPDGKKFAFVASVNQPVRSYTEPDL